MKKAEKAGNTNDDSGWNYRERRLEATRRRRSYEEIELVVDLARCCCSGTWSEGRARPIDLSFRSGDFVLVSWPEREAHLSIQLIALFDPPSW